jgi:hypothetical protein
MNGGILFKNHGIGAIRCIAFQNDRICDTHTKQGCKRKHIYRYLFRVGIYQFSSADTSHILLAGWKSAPETVYLVTFYQICNLLGWFGHSRLPRKTVKNSAALWLVKNIAALWLVGLNWSLARHVHKETKRLTPDVLQRFLNCISTRFWPFIMVSSILPLFRI